MGDSPKGKAKPHLHKLVIPIGEEVTLDPGEESPVDPEFPRKVNYSHVYSKPIGGFHEQELTGHQDTAFSPTASSKVLAAPRQKLGANNGLSSHRRVVSAPAAIGDNVADAKSGTPLRLRRGRGWDKQSERILHKLLSEMPETQTTVEEAHELPPYLQKLGKLLANKEHAAAHLSEARRKLRSTLEAAVAESEGPLESSKRLQTLRSIDEPTKSPQSSSRERYRGRDREVRGL